MDISAKKDNIAEYLIDNTSAFYRVAFTYVKDKNEAMDIVQEAIYKALMKQYQLRDIRFIRTWFYKILINCALEHIRKNKKIIYTEDVLEYPGLNNEYNLVDINLDLNTALDLLDDKHRIVIVLRYFEDMKISEMAKVLSVNENTVKTRLRTALKKLNILLGEDEI